MYSSAQFKTMFPELSKLYTQEELDKACSYLPDNDGTDFPKWVETVNATVDEPICPFVGWCECNSAGSDRCHTCSFAQEMFVYSMGGQAKRDTIQPAKTYSFGYVTMYTGMYDLDPTVREVTAESFREAYDLLVAENAYGDPYFRVVSIDGIPWDDAMFMPEYQL